MSLSVLRIKRHIDEDPEETLQQAQKKQKIKEFVFTFKATGVSEEEAKQLVKKEAKRNFEKIKKNYKLGKPSEKAKTKLANNTKGKRADLVNKNRPTKKEDGGNLVAVKAGEVEESLSVIDWTTDGPTLSHSTIQGEEFVYDLYFNSQQNVAVGDLVDVSQSRAGTVHEPEFQDEMKKVEQDYEEQAEDSDDSNNESNWRNDYPDTESDDEKSPHKHTGCLDYDDDTDDDWLAYFNNRESELEKKMASCCLAKEKKVFSCCGGPSTPYTSQGKGSDDEDDESDSDGGISD